MPVNGPRRYALVQDLNSVTVFGPEDGTAYYGIKPYNIATIASANQDGSAGQNADMGVKDNDLATILGLANWYVVNLGSASASTDVKITFPGVIHQLIIDNTRNANACFIEMADTAAGTGSIQVLPQTFASLSCNTTIAHIYTTSSPVGSNVVVRGQ